MEVCAKVKFWAKSSSLQFASTCAKYLLPLDNLKIIEDYFKCLERIAANDKAVLSRFKALYLCLAVRLVISLVLLMAPGMDDWYRLVLCDNVFVLNLPSSFSIFNVSFVVVPFLFYYFLYIIPKDDPVHMSGYYFIFQPRHDHRMSLRGRVAKSQCRQMLRLINIFFNISQVGAIILEMICQVKIYYLTIEIGGGHICSASYLLTQLNWAILSINNYASIHCSNVTLSNLVANNSLELLRLKKFVFDFARRPLRSLNPTTISVYFRYLCAHLRVIHRLGRVYNLVVLGTCFICVPSTAYVFILIMFGKIPDNYKAQGFMMVSSEMLGVLLIHVLFAIYPRLVHYNVKRIYKMIITGRERNLHNRWKLAAHFEHFHVVDSKRYGFNYGGMGLVTVVSFLRIIKLFTEFIMFSCNLIT